MSILLLFILLLLFVAYHYVVLYLNLRISIITKAITYLLLILINTIQISPYYNHYYCSTLHTTGIDRALATNKGLSPSYFFYECTEFEMLVPPPTIPGQPAPSTKVSEGSLLISFFGCQEFLNRTIFVLNTK